MLVFKSLHATLGCPLPSANWTWPRDIWEQTRRTLICEEGESKCHFSFTSTLPTSLPIQPHLPGTWRIYLCQPSSKSLDSIKSRVLIYGDDPSHIRLFLACSTHQLGMKTISSFLFFLPSNTSRSGNTLC